ncbi:MAG TPA: DUF1707 domain-containing protein [Trebonia sp.]|nr:DUF1707 domain-containing protein [Trebonia sp.]
MADEHGTSPEVHSPRPQELRASHADRDLVVEQLRVAAGDGRLSAEELDERLELALSARTYADLVPLTADLPPEGTVSTALAPAAGGQVAGRATPKDLVKIDCGSGHARRDGQWVVPRRLEVKVTSGHVRLDFTKAIITEPVLELVAEVRSGHLQIITRPGIAVDAGEVAVRSGHVSVRAPWDGSVPVQLNIDVTGSVRSGHLAARPPRRSFWQWLRRAPRPYAIAA